MAHMYNVGGKSSTIDKNSNSEQLSDFYFKRAVLIEAVKEMYFSQLADTTTMPKGYGKTIKQYVFIPLLDDRNVNDQGLDAKGAKYNNGNLYGSTRDIGTITDKLPAISETGGRVNRVGFSRRTLEAAIHNQGFFYEFTRDELAFDTMQDLKTHLYREAMRGAKQIYEDTLQIDLINAAGTVRYTGTASQRTEIEEVVTYKDIMHLGIALDKNLTPKKLKMVKGSRMVDTLTIPNARAMYVGSELIPTLKSMTDSFGQPAFKEAHHYAAGTQLLHGEIGSIDQFRIILVPEMLKWAAGGKANSDPDYYGNGTNVDVFPMLVVGEGSFTTVGFHYSGKDMKFETMMVMPGQQSASAHYDPYGKLGFVSIQWWYGFMALRPERIGLILTAAKK